jgi:hypothetical protein
VERPLEGLCQSGSPGKKRKITKKEVFSMKNKIKVLGIIVLTAIIGFSMMSCEEPIQYQYSLTITDIPATYHGKLAVVSLATSSSDINAYAIAAVTGAAVTFPLLDWDTDDIWGKNGSYTLVVLIYENAAAISNKVTLFEGGTLSKVSVSSDFTIVPWSQIIDVKDMKNQKMVQLLSDKI